ncbi:hypothetical protein K435DRAFT_787507, partial [Dendrothele bispora CBS 962.96]
MSSSVNSPSILIKDLIPVLVNIVVCAVWFGFSVPLLFLLFWTSKAEKRRTPIFIANAASLSFGVILGLLNVILLVKSLTTPSTSVNRPAQIAFATLLVLTGELIDSVLIFRIILVIPRRRTSPLLWWPVFLFLVALKFGRLAIILAFMVFYTRKARFATTSDELGSVAMSMPEPVIAWVLQIVDNSFCSFIFLYWLHQAQSLSRRVGGEDGKARFADRIRVLFWIALSNYVFPTVIALALLINFVIQRNYSETLLVMLCNIYVEIFGVMFATVWAQSDQKSSTTSALGTRTHSLHFSPGHGTSVVSTAYRSSQS